MGPTFDCHFVHTTHYLHFLSVAFMAFSHIAALLSGKDFMLTFQDFSLTFSRHFYSFWDKIAEIFNYFLSTKAFYFDEF